MLLCIRLFVRGSPWLLYTNPVKSPSVYLSAERCWECREGGRKEGAVNGACSARARAIRCPWCSSYLTGLQLKLNFKFGFGYEIKVQTLGR